MAARAEQCGGRLVIRLRAGTRRWLKRQTAKLRRRIERRDPEAAPAKRAAYHGWFD